MKSQVEVILTERDGTGDSENSVSKVVSFNQDYLQLEEVISVFEEALRGMGFHFGGLMTYSDRE